MVLYRVQTLFLASCVPPPFLRRMIPNQPRELLPCSAFPILSGLLALSEEKTCLPLKELSQGRRKIKGRSGYTIQRENRTFLIGPNKTPVKETEMSGPAEGGQWGNVGIGLKTRRVQGRVEKWACWGCSVTEIGTCTRGGGEGRVGEKAPNPSKLISANVMFSKILG